MSGAKKAAIVIGVFVALFLIIGFFPQDCAICDGQGVHPCFVSAEYHLGADCPYCQGTGTYTLHDIRGNAQSRTCSLYQGNGYCGTCDGTGLKPKYTR